MSNDLTRRSFVKWGTATAGATALAGLVGCALAEEGERPLGETGKTPPTGHVGETGNGQWKIGGCLYNCSCGSSRCLLRVYTEDGVPLRIETDMEEEDEIENIQRRACPRGYGQISRLLSPARLKYPMRRKGWSPDNPNGEMRGKDEWERISWDEALTIVAEQTHKMIDTYGPRSILISGWVSMASSLHLYDPAVGNFLALGAGLNAGFGTVSLGSWAIPSIFMTGEWACAPDFLSLLDSELHILFGCNWAANKAGNVTYHLAYAREHGARVIIIDPWLNRTAQAVADEWIPIIPGTDTALVLALAYQQIENGWFDQGYLDTYCVGFDADHMPEGALPEDNFKDYVLGTYDGEPKTPEWAENICGVPADTIRNLAKEIGETDKINFFGGQSVTKIPAGEMFVQAFYAMALMHGGIGSPGHYMTWIGHNEHNYSSVKYAKPGKNVDPTGLNPKNSLTPPGKIMTTVNLSAIEDNEAWDDLEYSECWQSILDGEYGRDCWPGGKRPLDVHMIYSGARGNFLNQQPNANAGIKVYRSVDFVVGSAPFFDANVKYADIALPVAMDWEVGNIAWQYNSDTVLWMDKVQESLYEAKPLSWIAEQLAEKLSLNPREIVPASDAERTYASLKDAAYLTDARTLEYAPLLTITEEDIAAMGVEGEPQEGLIPLAEFKEKGIYKPKRKKGDALMYTPYQSFFENPTENPLKTSTGKFEIYCPSIPAVLNPLGFSKLSPIGKWQLDKTQGIGGVTSEYPLLLWTPHSLRRGHSVNDNVISLREAHPQECYMSVIDAEARGLKNGDIVLMSSPHGKVLRPVKITPTVVPGSVALEEGAWIDIDEDTGIDLAGNPNILQAPVASGEGSQSWTGTIVQVEKYEGDIELGPDKNRPIVVPVGIEE